MKQNPLKEYFECECEDLSHTLRMDAFKDSPKEIYIQMYLAQNAGFFKRIVIAIKYVFGFRSKYGHFGETILGQEEATNMRNFIDKCLKE